MISGRQWFKFCDDRIDFVSSGTDEFAVAILRWRTNGIELKSDTLQDVDDVLGLI